MKTNIKKQNARTLLFIVALFVSLFFGALIFSLLESKTENTLQSYIETVENKYKNDYNISNEEFLELEDAFEKYNTYKNYPQWSFTSAFYFSLTVITTIGIFQ